MKTWLILFLFLWSWGCAEPFKHPPEQVPPPELGPYSMNPIGAKPSPESGSKIRTREKPLVVGQENRPAADEVLLSGTIRLKPKFKKSLPKTTLHVVYVIARRSGGGPPMAVRRYQTPEFPLTFELSNQNTMIQGSQISGKVILTARIDADGQAGPLTAEDYEGGTTQPVEVPATGIEILIDRKGP